MSPSLVSDPSYIIVDQDPALSPGGGLQMLRGPPLPPWEFLAMCLGDGGDDLLCEMEMVGDGDMEARPGPLKFSRVLSGTFSYFHNSLSYEVFPAEVAVRRIAAGRRR